MGLRDKLFGKGREPQAVEIPAILQPENPVNYDSVLDWLLGLSKQDYDKMLKVVTIYRDANMSAAKVLKVKDQATTQLIPAKLTDDEMEEQLDALLETDPADLKAAIEAEQPAPENKKPQAPSKDTKITVTEQ